MKAAELSCKDAVKASPDVSAVALMTSIEVLHVMFSSMVKIILRDRLKSLC